MTVAIVGMGYIGKIHARTLSEIGETKQLVAVCDLSDECRRYAEKELGVPSFPSLVDLLEEMRPEGLLLCTPPDVRLELVELAVDAGVRGLFIEKPLALSMDEAGTIVDSCERSQVGLHVGLAYRFQDTTRRALELIHSGELGSLCLLEARFWTGIPGPEWWVNENRSGGLLVDQCAHLFDLLYLLGGEVSQLSGYSLRGIANQSNDLGVLEAVTLSFGFKSGVAGVLSTTCRAPFLETNYVDIKCVATKGVVILEPRVSEMRVYRRMGRKFMDETGWIARVSHRKSLGYERELRAFLSDLNGDKVDYVSGQQALASLHLSLRALESCRIAVR